MKNIRLIAFDLDGTVLTGDKRLTQRNKEALSAAARAGIAVVPSTGRCYVNIPDAVRELECIDYAITINGSYVLDVKKDECLYSADMDPETAVAVMKYLDAFPVCYDCYLDNKGWMTKALQDSAHLYADGYYLETIRSWRTPVPELKQFVIEQNKPVQKVQFFIRDLEQKAVMAKELERLFPQTVISSSLNNNVEVNDRHANKGEALLALAQKLGIRREEIMAFGDGSNDFSMIRAAGIGVVMENGRKELKEIADIIAPSCNDDGVGRIIEQVLEAKNNDI